MDERVKPKPSWRTVAVLRGEPCRLVTPAVEITEAKDGGEVRHSITCGVFFEGEFRSNLHLHHHLVPEYVRLLEQALALIALPKRRRGGNR